jgi:hypothetical protein
VQAGWAKPPIIRFAPPVTSRSNRERARGVPLARRVAGKSGASPEGRTKNQLNVPC